MATFHPIRSSSPPINTNQQAVATTKEEEVGNELLDSETYKTLMSSKGGLSNDVNQWVDELVALNGPDDFPFLKGNNIASAAQKIKRLNEVLMNKQLWTEAISVAEKQGGLNEVAVGTSGELFVRDKDAKLKAISMSEYAKNKDKYNPITFYELMMERNQNPNLAFNNSIFAVSATAIGTNKIIENISQLVDKVGSYTQSITQTYGDKDLEKKAQMLAVSMTGKQPSQTELEALGKLQIAIMNSPSKYNEVKESSKNSEKYLSSALTYIWTSLSREEQLKLSAVATMSGVSNPKEFIFNMLKSNKDESFELDVKPVDADKATGVDSGGSKDTRATTPFEVFHNGKLGRQVIPWNDPSSGKTFNLTATGVSRLMTVEGKPLGANTLFNVINSENGSLVDTSKIFYGDQKVSMNDLNELAYDGGLAMRVYAPVNSSGGVDYYKLEELKRIEEKVNEDLSLTPEQINELYAQSGFSYVSVDNKKQYIMNDRFKPFLMFTAYGTDEMDSTKNNAKIKALSGGEEDQIEDILKRIWSENKVSAPVGKLWTNYYKGMVAIPYIEDSSIYAGTIAKNIKSPTSTLTDVRLQKEKAKGTTINASSQNLWQYGKNN